MVYLSAPNSQPLMCFSPCMRVSQTAAILDPSTGVSIAADNVSMVPLN